MTFVISSAESVPPVCGWEGQNHADNAETLSSVPCIVVAEPQAVPSTPPVARRLAERLRHGTVGSGSGGLRAIGALTGAATVSEELSLKLDFTKLDADFLKVASAPVFQRLDYLLNRPYGTDTLLCRK